MLLYARTMIPGVIALLALTSLAVAQNAPTPTDTPEPARVLVTADPGARRPDLTARAESLLREGLVKAGVTVVSLETARRLDRRVDPPQAEPAGGMRLGESAYAGVLVMLDVGADRERKIQGRYRVELSARVKMTNVEDATVLLEASLRGRATAFEGYREAHERALDDLGTGLTKRVTARLEALRKDEREKGALFTIGVAVTGGDPVFLATLADHLQKITGVAPGSVSLARSAREHGYHEYLLRYRGRSYTLVRAIHAAIQGQAAAGKDQVVEMEYAASARRVLLTLRTRPVASASSLDQEVKRVVDGMVAQVLESRGQAITGKRLAVEPTSIPTTRGPRARLAAFARTFMQAQESAERGAAAAGADDPKPKALDSGPVTIEGAEFATLRAAQAKLSELEAAYRGSRAATLASDIGRLVAAALEDGKLTVLTSETDLTTVLDRIKREAALHREEGAIDPETIALLNTSGAEALVLTWFRPFLQSYVFRIAIIDCKSGEEIVHLSRVLDEKFKSELDAVFGG